MFGKRAIQKEFEEQALPHMDALYAMAMRLCRNDRDAEDLVQDTILRAFRFFHRFEKGTNCKAWLFKILTNTFINRYQKGSREREVVHAVEHAEGYEPFLSPDSAHVQTPEQALLGHVMSDDVTRALEEVPDEFRMVVLLADVEEFSYKEIAEIMDCPIGTVMSRLYRGRRLLQRTLYQYALDAGILQAAAGATPAVAAQGGSAQDADSSLVDLGEYRRKRRDGR